MPPPDLDIHLAAYLLIRQHGDKAMARGREKIEEMRRRDDAEAADTWLRIIVAVEAATLIAPPNRRDASVGNRKAVAG
jgi:hypothetical protein